MTTTKTTPYLVSDRAYRIILTEIIERLTTENVTPECFYATISFLTGYMKTGETDNDSLCTLPADGYRIFMLFRDLIDKSIRRSRSARAAAARRKEKRATPSPENDTNEDKPFRPDQWPPQSAGKPGPMVRELNEIFFGNNPRPAW